MRHFFLFASLILMSCKARPARITDAGERKAIAEDLEWFRATWLAPARIAPPTVPRDEVATQTGELAGTARLLLPEEASWNRWSTPGGRLFNNRIAHLFEVDVTAPGPVRWIPEETRLEVNRADTVHRAARSSEELLLPLMRAAIDEERAVLDGDLVARTRAAGGFRSAYLQLAGEGGLAGIIAFPNETNTEHVTAMRLTISFEHEGNRIPLVWTLD